MKQIKNLTLCLATALLLLAACTAETDNLTGQNPDHNPPTHGKLIDVTLTLTPQVPKEVQTRATGQGLPDELENAGIDVDEMKYVQLFQYDMESGNNIHSDYDVEIAKNGSSYEIKCTLKNVPSKIYVVVNAEVYMSQNNTMTENNFLTSYLDISEEAHILSCSNVTGLPMCGVYTGIPTPKMNISVKRSVAKLGLQVLDDLPSGHTFQCESVQVKQVSGCLMIAENPNVTTPNYNGMKDYPSVNPQGELYYWFLTENCRGIGTATTPEEKNADTAPAGQGDKCTYVEIKGKYNSGTHWVGALDVTYRVYLGGNNTNDYNVRRNTNYNVTITIRGANRVDSRITVTGTEQAATYLDYTDNFTPWMAVAKENHPQTALDYISWLQLGMTGADGSPCPAGWRVPTIEELMLMFIYKAPLGDFPVDKPYWSSSPAYDKDGASEYVTSALKLDTGEMGSYTMYNYKVRCVRDI